MELRERVVHATLEEYARLPKHGKPAVRDSGVPEWTILASITLTRDDIILPVAISTGVKVLPAARYPPLGDTIHDSHAEVLCRRGLVRWLHAEAEKVVRREQNSGFVAWDQTSSLFRLVDTQVWLYVSALPCGDASTLHTSAHQASDVAEAFAAAPECTLSPEGAVRGRRGYENYGAIRTKPGRPDSPPSISFSCSDKIASWSVLGLQGALLASVFEPVYLDHIIVGGVDEPPGYPNEERWSEAITKEAERALFGRLGSLQDSVSAPYRVATPTIHLTPTPFHYAKSAVLSRHPGCSPATSNVSLSFLAGWKKPEVITNGCSGTSGWKPPGTSLLKNKMRSRLCKLEIMRCFMVLREEMAVLDDLPEIPQHITYYDLKQMAGAYQAAKCMVRGVPSGELSPAWAEMLPHGFAVTTGSAPFAGWITCGRKYESFTCEGELKECL